MTVSKRIYKLPLKLQQDILICFIQSLFIDYLKKTTCPYALEICYEDNLSLINRHLRTYMYSLIHPLEESFSKLYV